MKFFSVLFFLLFVSTAFAAPDTKKEYRLGLKGGIISPSSASGTQIKNDALSLLLELDVKRSNRLDTGLRFGYDAFATQSSNYYACYEMFQLGYGVRYYFDERQSPETTYHTFKKYVLADGFAVLANKYRDLDSTINSPQNFYGFGARAGAGLEYVFGPLSSGFVELEYAGIYTKTSNGNLTLRANGLMLAFGVRLSR